MQIHVLPRILFSDLQTSLHAFVPFFFVTEQRVSADSRSLKFGTKVRFDEVDDPGQRLAALLQRASTLEILHMFLVFTQRSA